MALVQPAAGASPEPEALTQWLTQRLARYKVPRELQLRAELPRDDNGKIAKRRLRAEFWAGRQRKV
ncbi:long-chain-fatty-acid--CoA ligase [compost metagenome]